MNNIITDSDFEQIEFNDITINDETLDDKFFFDCIFTNCDFTDSKFVNCKFNNCKFLNCNLSLIKIPKCYLSGNTFDKCKMVGIDWTVGAWKTPSKKRQPFTNIFRNSSLDYSFFVGMNLTEIKMIHCTAKEVYFDRAIICEGDFDGTDLERAIFTNCDLTKTDFSNAQNYSINPTLNIISQAKFSMPEALALIYALDIEIVG